jgi:AcrR family transcriptional regulator
VAVAEIPPALARSSVEQRQVSREVRRQERREGVLERMTDVFAKRGYQAATVDQLIAGGKISMGGFYEEFDGKEDCFVAVYDRAVGDAAGRIAAAVDTAPDWSHRVALGLRAAVEFAAERTMAARVILLEAQTGGARIIEGYAATRREVAGVLRQGRSVAEAGQTLPESFEDATVSGLAWLLQTRLSRGRIEDPEVLWPHMVKMVLEPYVGAAQADRVVRSIA